MREKKLIRQLYPSYLLVIFLTLIPLLLFTSNTFKSFYKRQTTKDLKAITLLMETQVLPHLKTKQPQQLQTLTHELGQKIDVRFTVIALNGRVLADSEKHPKHLDNHANRPEIIQALTENWGSSMRYSHSLQTHMLYVAKPLKNKQGQNIGVLRSALPLDDINKTLTTLTKELTLWGAILSLFSALIGFFVSRKLTAPINELANGAEQLSDGNLGFQLSIPKTKELKKLAIAFNHMSVQLKDRLEASIAQTQEKEAILANMVEGIITVDKNGAITTMNQATKTYFLIDDQPVIGKSLPEVIRHSKLNTITKDALKTPKLLQENITLRHPKELYLHVHAIRMVDTRQNCIGAIVVLHNITHLQKLENMRKNFVANVSHELKTPITLIKGFLETLLSGDLDNKDDNREFLNIIQDHACRLETIIDDLLSLSRIEQEHKNSSIEMHPETINKVIDSAITSCQKNADEKNITLLFKPTEHLNSTLNVSLLEQALINLIDNAIKYSPAHSSINIELYKTKTEHIISITDQGPGIPENHIPHIFERFYRVDAARSREVGGTGLGLSIVKHIVESHNGSVSVESSVGKGSRFSINLPIIV